MPSAEENVLSSLVLVGLLVEPLRPREAFRTPPWMVRRFAVGLVSCASREEVERLVVGSAADAAAFVIAGAKMVEDFGTDSVEWEDPGPCPEVTAAGHFAIALLDEMEQSYPEGLTEEPE